MSTEVMSTPQTERMEIAALIERMADKQVSTFSPEDAERVFDALWDLPISRPIVEGSITTQQGGGGHTTNGEELPESENKQDFKIGKRTEFRCGTYVIMRMAKDALDIRHVADVMAAANTAEVLRLQRWRKGRFRLLLNNPITIGWLNTTIGGFYKTWKVSGQ